MLLTRGEIHFYHIHAVFFINSSRTVVFPIQIQNVVCGGKYLTEEPKIGSSCKNLVFFTVRLGHEKVSLACIFMAKTC